MAKGGKHLSTAPKKRVKKTKNKGGAHVAPKKSSAKKNAIQSQSPAKHVKTGGKKGLFSRKGKKRTVILTPEEELPQENPKTESAEISAEPAPAFIKDPVYIEEWPEPVERSMNADELGEKEAPELPQTEKKVEKKKRLKPAISFKKKEKEPKPEKAKAEKGKGFSLAITEEWISSLRRWTIRLSKPKRKINRKKIRRDLPRMIAMLLFCIVMISPVKGCVMDGDYIGYDAAKKAAVKDAGMNYDAAKNMEIDMIKLDGQFCYKIEFTGSVTEYRYIIDAESGDVVSQVFFRIDKGE